MKRKTQVINMQWIEVTVNTLPEKLHALTDKLENLGVEGLVIDDEGEYRDFLENNRQYWDYIDEDLENAITGVSRVKFYLEDSEEGRGELERIRKALPEEKMNTQSVRDEDWENNWKQYYKPLEIGEKLIIVPEWEEVPENTGRCVMRLDPGLIFGTGGHATTRMCLEALEKCCEGERVLDLGCGSGILSIAALLLGAKEAVGCDIDPKAPNVAMENAALNGITGDTYSVFAGDVLSDSKLSYELGNEKFGVVLANIVADVIIALAPHITKWLSDDGLFICSGIIEGREKEVEAALENAGFEILEHYTQEGWNCYKTKEKK